MASIGELFVELTVDSNDGAVKVGDMIGLMEGLNFASMAAVGSIASLGYAFGKMIENSMLTAVGFQKFTNQTGLSAMELQRWQIVAAQANVSTEAITSSVQGLQKALALISIGQGNKAPFQILGINPEQSVWDILTQLRRTSRRYPRAIFTQQLSQMGISPEMMNVLMLSDEMFNKYMNTITGLTPKANENLLALKLTLTELLLKGKEVGYVVAENLSPALNTLIKTIGDMFSFVGAGNIISAITGIALAFSTTLYPAITSVVGALLILQDMYEYFKGNKNTLTGGAVGLYNDLTEQDKMGKGKLWYGNNLVGGMEEFIRPGSSLTPEALGIKNSSTTVNFNQYNQGLKDPDEIREQTERGITAAQYGATY